MSWGNYNYDRVELHLKDGKIDYIKNLRHLKHLSDFSPEFKTSDIAKIYLVKTPDFYQYVGATIQAIHTELNQGLNSKGENGYHGYKWKSYDKVELFVWTFEGIVKSQMEAIEAELVYQIRNKYGRWTDSQNEIHFNNKFPFAIEIGKDLFTYIEREYPIQSDLGHNKITDELFKEPMQHGLRGDPYLWKDLKVRFEYSGIKTSGEFREFLINTFEEITGYKPNAGKNFGVKHYDLGGMSSGSVNSDFWIEKGFPLLEERFMKLKK